MKISSPQMYQSAEPLRIGYLENDGYSEGSPSMVRGVREVKALLEKAGHTVRPQYWHTQTQTMWSTPTWNLWFELCVLMLSPFWSFVPVVGALHSSGDTLRCKWTDNKGCLCRRNYHLFWKNVSSSYLQNVSKSVSVVLVNNLIHLCNWSVRVSAYLQPENQVMWRPYCNSRNFFF